MADFKTIGSTPQALSSGIAASASINRRGEQLAIPWHVQLALEGKLFVAGVGSATTPITTNLNLVIDLTQPAFLLRVPQGTTVVPLYVHAYYEATGAAIAEGIISIADNDPGSGTSSALTRTPTNLVSNGGGQTSACTGAQIVTAALTLTNQREIWRFGEPADLDSAVTGGNHFQWSYQTHIVPVLHGPAAMLVDVACGTSGSVFVNVIWAEFRTSDLT